MRQISLITILLVVITVTLSTTTFAQDFIELRIAMSKDETTPQFEVSYQGIFNHSFGWSVYSLINQYWAQTYVGPTYSPASWCQFGFSLGIETDDNPIRFGSFLLLWIGRGKGSVLAVYEDGGSGKWHRIVPIYQITSWWGLGVMEESFIGFGPRTDISVGPFKFYTALLRESNVNTALLAAGFNF